MKIAVPVSLICICAALASDPSTHDVNVREHHSHAYFINLPVAPASLQAMLPAGLKPDVFNNTAWISVDVDKFDKLEKVVFGKYVDTHMGGGHFMKVNFLVTSASYGPGYFIHSLDFDSLMMNLGCKATQSFACHKSTFEMPSNNLQFGVARDGGQMHAKFTVGGETNKDFVSFVLGRRMKYARQGGKLIAVDQFPPASPSSYPQDTQPLNLDGSDVDLGLLQLGKDIPDQVAGWSVCDSGTCFLDPSYVLVDHTVGNEVPPASATVFVV